MKNKDFEPAKILSKPDPEPKEEAISSASPNVAGPDLVPLATDSQVEPTGEKKADVPSWDGILDGFTGKAKEEHRVVWAMPYDMFQNGAFNGLFQSPIDMVARDIKGIVITTIFHAYLLIGYYLLAVFFDNDESLAFSRSPYKGTSINDLSKRDDIPFTRQKLTECIKAAAVDMELRKRGHQFDRLNFDHLSQLAQLKKWERRLEFARKADETPLTPGELKRDIDAMFGKAATHGKRIGQAVLKHLREFVRMANDEEVQDFLADKERSAVLDPTEIAQLLELSGKFRAAAADHEEMLVQFEVNLVENFSEKQQAKKIESGKEQKMLES